MGLGTAVLVLADPQIERGLPVMNGSTRRQPGERRLSSGKSQWITSGTKFVRRIARPRTGSGSMSSLYL